MSVDIFICRTCLTPTTEQFCKIISEFEDSRILEMLSYSIPEMDMYLVTNPVICNKCFLMLKTTFEFKSQCLNNEERLLKYVHKFNIDKVDFSDYCKHMGVDKRSVILNNNYQECTTAVVNPQPQKSLELKSKQKMNRKKLESQKNLNCKNCRGCTLQDSNPCLHLKVNVSPFICALCDRQYKRIEELRKHMLAHTKQRQCQVCQKSFRDLHVLRKHMWCHTGTKPYSCHLCPKQFQQKHCLKQHIQQHEGNENISCRICKKLFSTKYNARVHMKSAHKIRDYCDLCRQPFNTKSEYVKHLENESKICIQIANKFLDKEKEAEKFLKFEPDYVPLDAMTIKNEPIDETPSIGDNSEEKTNLDLLTSVKKENIEEIDIMN